MTDTFHPDDFYDLTLVTDLALSPDGNRIAFVADEFDRTEDDRRTSLFVLPADGATTRIGYHRRPTPDAEVVS